MARKGEGDPHLSISQAAKAFHISRQQIHNCLNAGVLRMVERKVVVRLIRRADLERLAKERGWMGKGDVKKRGRKARRRG
jgi:hypothetical protein